MTRLYDSTAWKRLRRAHLAANPLCKLCEASGRIVIAEVADHVIPHRGDPALFFEGELQSLCTTCHNSAKQRQEKRGVLVGHDRNGDPIDPNHPWNR